MKGTDDLCAQILIQGWWAYFPFPLVDESSSGDVCSTCWMSYCLLISDFRYWTWKWQCLVCYFFINTFFLNSWFTWCTQKDYEHIFSYRAITRPCGNITEYFCRASTMLLRVFIFSKIIVERILSQIYTRAFPSEFDIQIIYLLSSGSSSIKF